MACRARRIHHQPGRVGVAHQEIEIDAVGLQQLMHDRQHQQAVGAGRDADPFVGDRRIAGAHRIDRDELGAVVGGAVLQLPQADLDRVAAVILGDAEHQEIARALPVRLAELPERAADGVEPGGRHVDRAEAAMRRIVGRAELRRPPAGQCLALVAAGEEGELLGVGRADAAQPLGRELQRLVPLDLLELALAALADALQRLAQPRRRIVRHDSGGALGAQDSLVHRVVAVAFDVADAAVLQVHLDAAAAGAHVAGRGRDLVVHLRRIVDRLLVGALLGRRLRLRDIAAV